MKEIYQHYIVSVHILNGRTPQNDYTCIMKHAPMVVLRMTKIISARIKAIHSAKQTFTEKSAMRKSLTVIDSKADYMKNI